MRPSRLWQIWQGALLGVVTIPLGSPEGWEVLQFRKTPAHRVEFMSSALKVHVRKSAGPLIYPLPEPTKISRVLARGKIGHGFAIPKGSRQGEKGSDDFALRIGLVVRGDKRLNWLQKKIAPQWVNRLYSIAPAGLGVDRIEFFNLVERPLNLGVRRRHPLSDLLFETYVQYANPDGTFEVDHPLSAPLEVIGLWLSIDGDDLNLSFDLMLEDLRLFSP